MSPILQPKTDQLIVNVDIPTNGDIPTLVIMKKTSRNTLTIMNTIQGEEALFIYDLLLFKNPIREKEERSYHEHSFRVNIR